MAAAADSDAPVPLTSCARCGASSSGSSSSGASARLSSRPLCSSCFTSSFQILVLQNVRNDELLLAGNSSLCLALSGGPSSLALLDAICTTCARDDSSSSSSPSLSSSPRNHHNERQQVPLLKGKEKMLANQQKRRLHLVVAVHVVEAENGGEGVTKALRKACEERNVKLHTLKPITQTHQSLLARVRDATARHDAVTFLRNRAIANFAASMKCGSVLCGESADGTAARILSSISKRVGAVVNADLGAADIRMHLTHGLPFFVHPMRSISRKEAAIYCRHRHIQLPCLPIAPPDNPRTIDACSEALVASMVAERADAAINVIRAAQKLDAYPFSIPVSYNRGDKAQRIDAGRWRPSGAEACTGTAPHRLCSLCLTPVVAIGTGGSDDEEATAGQLCMNCRTNVVVPRDGEDGTSALRVWVNAIEQSSYDPYEE